jgi:hypothetical protein
VHHYVCPVAVSARRVGYLAAEEDAGVRVHGGLVLGHGLVQLPDDDALGVVEEVLADAGNVLDNGDLKGGELVFGAETREKHETRGVDGASAEDGLAVGGKDALLSVL